MRGCATLIAYGLFVLWGILFADVFVPHDLHTQAWPYIVLGVLGVLLLLAYWQRSALGARPKTLCSQLRLHSA